MSLSDNAQVSWKNTRQTRYFPNWISSVLDLVFMLFLMDNIFAGSMCYMSGMIQMDNILPPENAGVNVWQLVFGRSPSTTVYVSLLPIFLLYWWYQFQINKNYDASGLLKLNHLLDRYTNMGPQDGYIGIAAPSLARILPVLSFYLPLVTLLTIKCCHGLVKSFALVTCQSADVTSVLSSFLTLVTDHSYLQVDLAMFGGAIICQVVFPVE